MQIDDRALELLLQWEDAGGELSEQALNQLAGEDMVLAADLKRYALQLRKMDWLNSDEQAPASIALDIEIVKSAALVPESMSLEAFKKQLKKANIIESETLEAFFENDQSSSSSVLCRKLLKAELLTSFQLRAITHGKTRGLRMDRYVILDRIGKGGMGQVFKAKHAKMKRVVALKVLPREAMKNQNAVARFFRESEAAARLNHANIVTAFDAGESEGLHYLVMEYIEGRDLDQVVRRRGPLRVATAIDYLKQAANGLEFAHQNGLIHRDIKPANMLLDENGIVKILDMGIARFVREAEAEQEDKEITHEGAVIGTIDYMAPEQAINSKSVDRTVDLYGLGCTLHYLLTGHPPFDEGMLMVRMLAHREKCPPNLCEVRKDVPTSLDDIFQKLMAKSPQDRYASATELLCALETVQADVERLEAEVGEQSSLTIPEEDLDTSRTNFIETIRTFDFGPLIGSRDSRDVSSKTARKWPLVCAAAALAVASIAVLAAFLVANSRGAGIVVVESDQGVFEKSIRGKSIGLQNTTTQEWIDVKLNEASQAIVLAPGKYRLAIPADSGLTASVQQLEVTPDAQSKVLIQWFAGGEIVDIESDQETILPSEVLTASTWGWGEPKNLGLHVNTSADDYGPAISPDGLELIVPSRREGGQGDYDLWSFKRSSRDQHWNEGSAITLVNSPHSDAYPFLSSDGLMLLFTTSRNGENELFASSRRSTNEPWESPRKLPVNFAKEFNYRGCCVSPDRRELIFAVTGPDKPGLYVSTRRKVGDPFPEPNRVGWSDTKQSILNPRITADSKALLFQIDTSDEKDIWISQRENANTSWSKPKRLFDSRIGCLASGPSLTEDGRELYFVGRELGKYRSDIYCVRRIPRTSITQASASPFKTRKVLAGSTKTRILAQHSSEEIWTFDPKQAVVSTVNLKTGKGTPLLTLESSEDVQQICGLPVAGLLAVVRPDRIDLVDSQTLATTRSISLPECEQVRAIGSPDGSKIFAMLVQEDGTKHHAGWQVRSGELLWMSSDDAEMFNIQSISPDGELIAVGNDSGRIEVLDSKTGQVRFDTNIPVKKSGCLAPDQHLVFTNSYDEIVVRDLTTGHDKVLSWSHPGYFNVKFSPDGRKLLAYGSRMFQILDWESKERIVQSNKLRNKIDRLSWNLDNTSILEVKDNWITQWHWDYSGSASEGFEVVSSVPYTLDHLDGPQWTEFPLTEENVSTPSFLDITQKEICYKDEPINKQSFRHSSLKNLPQENVVVSMKVDNQAGVETGFQVQRPGVRTVSIFRQRQGSGHVHVGEYFDAGEKWQWRGLASTPDSVQGFAELAILLRKDIVALYHDGTLVATTTGFDQAVWALRFNQKANKDNAEATITDIRYALIPTEPVDLYRSYQQDPPWPDYFNEGDVAPGAPMKSSTDLASSNNAPARVPKEESQEVPLDSSQVVPFDAETARRAQEAWAAKLGAEVAFTNSLGTEFRLIPPGRFTRSMVGKEYQVEITRPIYMGVHEVTREQFEAILPSVGMELPEYGFGESRGRPQNIASKNPGRLPICNISWTDCQNFLRKLNQLETGYTYRLPSEAEWEYACRAGTTTPFNVGDKITSQYAHYNADRKLPYDAARPIEVGQFSANPFGLYDMHGNVHEWTHDWFESKYFSYASRTDPGGPLNGTDRVYRGGSFRSTSESSLRSSRRDRGRPDSRIFDVGFRVVCEVDQSPRMPAKPQAQLGLSSPMVTGNPSPKPIDGQLSSGLAFDGNDDYVELPQLPISRRDQFTIEAWVTPLSDYPSSKQDLLPEATIFGWSPNQGVRLAAFHESLGAYVESARFDGSVGEDNPFTRLINIKYPLPLYEPTHVALCFDKGLQVTFFENGRKLSSTSLRSLPLGLDQPPIIGASRGADHNIENYFRGIVHQLQISKGIKYEGFFTPQWNLASDSKTVCLYHFNSGHGNTVADNSGNGRDGKIQGARWDNCLESPKLPGQQWTHLIEQDQLRSPHHIIGEEEFLFVVEQGKLAVHPKKAPKLRPHVMIPANCGPFAFRVNLSARDTEPDIQFVFRMEDGPQSHRLELQRRANAPFRPGSQVVVWGVWDGEYFITRRQSQRLAFANRRANSSKAGLHAVVLHGGVASSEWSNLAIYPLSEGQVTELRKARSNLSFGDVISMIGDAALLSD